MIGRKIIMRCWRSAEGPSFAEWSTELSKVAAFERISYDNSDRGEKYLTKWGRYLEYNTIEMGRRARPA